MCEARWEPNGKINFIQEGYQSVMAVPYDMPIVGYGNNMVNTLMIWDAEPINNFQLDSFDRGNTTRLWREENLARTWWRCSTPMTTTFRGQGASAETAVFLCFRQRAAGHQPNIRRNTATSTKFYEKVRSR